MVVIRDSELPCAAMRLMLTSLFAATIAVSTLTAQAPRIPADCNRACLEGLVNQYLDALVAHDPKRLPLAADVKYTENEQSLDVDLTPGSYAYLCDLHPNMVGTLTVS